MRTINFRYRRSFRSIPLSSEGFTILELMAATLAFSIILLVLTASVIQIGRMFFKGVVSSRTQESARTIIDAISRPIQFSAEPISLAAPSAPTVSSPAIGAVCIGTQRYTYAINAEVDGSVTPGSYTGGAAGDHKMQHGLWSDSFSGASCSALGFAQMSQPIPSAGGKELLQANARLTKFAVTAVSAGLGSPNLWKVDVSVMYGDDDLIVFADAPKDNPQQCEGAVNSAQWCALSELTTQVNQRLVQ